jgi:transcriptional regulator with PAS, ATPase and Fis domain
MGRIVLLVPRDEMLQTAHNIIQEKPYSIAEMRVVRTADTIVEARRAIGEGASIIIARGLQASLIKQYTNTPVVQIKATAQEMAILVMKARQIVKKEIPSIAVIGFENMFSDMSYFPELYKVRVETYFAETDEELTACAHVAAADGADIIIGGDTVVAAANALHLPSLFLTTTEDSLRQAFETAQSMDYAMSVEKKSAAQIETLLDYSYNGVIRIDPEGQVVTVNQTMEQMVDIDKNDIVGKNIKELIPQIDDGTLKSALKDGKESALMLEWNHISLYTIFAPIEYDSHIDGVLLTFNRVQKDTLRRKNERTGSQTILPPLIRFDDIAQHSAAMKECIAQAKLYAMSVHPVVLMGEPGTEKRMIAESIHNYGNNSAGPFLDVPCAGLTEEQQKELIFGERGAVMQTKGGTLFIQDIDELTKANQYRLYQLIHFNVVSGSDIAQLRRAEVRVLVSVSRPLGELYREGVLRSDLYYQLSGLELIVPPLRERSEDLKHGIDATLKKLYRQYGRYHVLTKEAMAYLLSCRWEGNLIQVESYCERLVITAQRRSIDENIARSLMEELYGNAKSGGMTYASGGGEDNLPMRARKIIEALEQSGGSRTKAAAVLGISKSTLWRQMKRYDIE